LEKPVRPLAERLAAYADGLRYDDLDPETIERVKSHVIDTLGCGIAAFDERPVRICRDLVLAAATGASTVIGTSQRTTPDLAAFANGAAFRYYDLNDVYAGRFSGHPSDNIAACLAVAESERASVRELITAIVLAYEVNCRLIDAFDITTRGWDPPVFNLPAVALAAGRLMKLPAERLTQAVNLAINDHIPMGQTRSQTLSDWKGLAAAEAARNAVFAAMLARAGITGPAPVFEGRRGFFQLVAGPADVDVGTFGRRDIPFRIHQCGMKAYPAVVYAQTAIVAGIALAKDIGDLDRVAAIEGTATLAASSKPEASQRNGRRAQRTRRITACRTSRPGPCSTAISLMTATPEKLRGRASLPSCADHCQEDPAFGHYAEMRQRPRYGNTRGRRPQRVENMPGFGEPMSRADVARSSIAMSVAAERRMRFEEAMGTRRTEDLPLLLGGFRARRRTTQQSLTRVPVALE
jgi:2-methylcitrate dehydratase